MYKARDKRDSKLVALKVMPAESKTDTLMKEIEVLKECQSPYIIAYRDRWLKNDRLWVCCHLSAYLTRM